MASQTPTAAEPFSSSMYFIWRKHQSEDSCDHVDEVRVPAEVRLDKAWLVPQTDFERAVPNKAEGSLLKGKAPAHHTAVSSLPREGENEISQSRLLSCEH